MALAGPALPVVAGFAFTVGTRIANIDKVKSRPSDGDFDDLMDEVRAHGDRLFATTKRGKNHPCQTEKLRVDYQGSVNDGDAANQQAQIGGLVAYNRSKGESTSITMVVADVDVNGAPNFKNALATAHTYSFVTRNVVGVSVAAAAAVPAAAPAGPGTATCPEGHQFDRQGWMSSGKKVGCPECGTYFELA